MILLRLYPVLLVISFPGWSVLICKWSFWIEIILYFWSLLFLLSICKLGYVVGFLRWSVEDFRSYSKQTSTLSLLAQEFVEFWLLLSIELLFSDKLGSDPLIFLEQQLMISCLMLFRVTLCLCCHWVSSSVFSDSCLVVPSLHFRKVRMANVLIILKETSFWMIRPHFGFVLWLSKCGKYTFYLSDLLGMCAAFIYPDLVLGLICYTVYLDPLMIVAEELTTYIHIRQFSLSRFLGPSEVFVGSP